MNTKSIRFRDMERRFVSEQGKAAADAIKRINKQLYRDLVIGYYCCPPSLKESYLPSGSNGATLFPGDD